MGFFTADRIGHGVALLTPVADGTKGQAILANGDKTLEMGDVVRWLGEWVSRTYYKHSMVRDGDWLMISNKETTDRAAPQAVGDELYGYDGTLVPQQATAKGVIFGTRYTAQEGTFLNGYRLDVVAGNHYEVYSVKDPLGVAEITQVLSFIADASGWMEFGLTPALVPVGTSLDVMCVVSEPDPMPTVWTGNWDYVTPNSVTAPTAGQVTHATKAIDTLSISKTDNDSFDRSAELTALTVGDIINSAGESWAIQAITNQGTYIDFNVLPANKGLAGVREFTFETVTATPITYGREVNYWAGVAGASGLLAIDGKYSDIVPDDNAYGVDIKIQRAIISPDWDVASSMGVGGGGGSGETTEFFTELLDTPTGYSASKGFNVVVKEDGTGLEFLPKSNTLSETVPTGLVDGGELNIGQGANDIELTAGSGVLVDSYTNPLLHPTVTHLSWNKINEAIVASPVAGTIVYFTVENGGPVAGPVAGTLLGLLNQRTVQPTQAEVRDEILIGYAIFNGTTWGEVSSPVVIDNAVHMLNEYVTSLRGPTYILNGGAITEAASFALNRAAGTVWERNRNWHVDRKNPHREVFSAQPGFSWRYVNSDMSIVTALVNTVNPDVYEDSPGSTGPVTGASIQRLFVDPRDNYWILYGQSDWADWNEAVLHLGSDCTDTVLPNLLEGSLLLGYIIADESETDWAPNLAVFMSVDEALGRGGGGAGGVVQDGVVVAGQLAAWTDDNKIRASAVNVASGCLGIGADASEIFKLRSNALGAEYGIYSMSVDGPAIYCFTSGTGPGIEVNSSHGYGIRAQTTNASAGFFTRNVATPTASVAVVQILQSHASDSNPALYVSQAGVGPAIVADGGDVEINGGTLKIGGDPIVTIKSVTLAMGVLGVPITTGYKGHVNVPFAGKIVGVTVLAEKAGGIVVDVWKTTAANHPPTVANTIVASAPPSLAAAARSYDGNLTGWTVGVAKDDVIAFNVNTVNAVEVVSVVLEIETVNVTP